jgi:hypothetical protein
LAASADPTAVQMLAQAFGLELPQLQLVLAWRAKFLATTGVASVFQRFNVTSLDDLIYLQWYRTHARTAHATQRNAHAEWQWSSRV